MSLWFKGKSLKSFLPPKATCFLLPGGFPQGDGENFSKYFLRLFFKACDWQKVETDFTKVAHTPSLFGESRDEKATYLYDTTYY